MSTPPEPAPLPQLTAAAEAAAGAVKGARLQAGPPEPPGDAAPAGLAFVVSLTVEGALEGTVTLAADDELVERLEYASSVSGPEEALAPVAAAIARSLGVEAGPLSEIETSEWPTGAEGVTTIALVGAADANDDPEDDRTLLVLAFALTVTPIPEDDQAVSGPGLSSLSTSAGPASTWIPPSARPGAILSAEARRLGAVEVDVAAVLGETTVILHDLLSWLPGVIVPLHRDVGMPVDVRIDDATVAHAEIVVVDERYALRVLDVVASAQARVERRAARRVD